MTYLPPQEPMVGDTMVDNIFNNLVNKTDEMLSEAINNKDKRLNRIQRPHSAGHYPSSLRNKIIHNVKNIKIPLNPQNIDQLIVQYQINDKMKNTSNHLLNNTMERNKSIKKINNFTSHLNDFDDINVYESISNVINIESINKLLSFENYFEVSIIY